MAMVIKKAKCTSDQKIKYPRIQVLISKYHFSKKELGLGEMEYSRLGQKKIQAEPGIFQTWAEKSILLCRKIRAGVGKFIPYSRIPKSCRRKKKIDSVTAWQPPQE